MTEKGCTHEMNPFESARLVKGKMRGLAFFAAHRQDGDCRRRGIRCFARPFSRKPSLSLPLTSCVCVARTPLVSPTIQLDSLWLLAVMIS